MNRQFIRFLATGVLLAVVNSTVSAATVSTPPAMGKYVYSCCRYAYMPNDYYVGGSLYNGGPSYRPYFKFDLGGYVGNIYSASVTLDLVGQNGYVSGFSFDLHEVVTPWSTGSLSWGNQPIFDPTVVSSVDGNYIQAESVAQRWPSTLAWDVTAQAKEWKLNPTQNFGIVLEADDSYGYPYLRTPRLVIETSPVPLPAAVWLFGSGLLGFAGFRSRKSHS